MILTFSIAAPFAERYLGLLNERDGQRHYLEADLTSCTKNLHTKHLLLLHGTLEEKYQATHSMLIAKSLIEKRFSFQQQVDRLISYLLFCIRFEKETEISIEF